MNDIKITDISGKKTDFEKKHIAPLSPAEAGAPEPGERVKVKFEKFVQLVATHNFEEVMAKHAADDIILNSNLLADLASSHTEEEPGQGKKLPIIFIVGIIVGVVVTYLLIRF